jgi:hypothetical protein
MGLLARLLKISGQKSLGSWEHQPDHIKERCEMLARNYEAYLRSENEGVINIRSKCVGIINMY